jgi:hypothetical protein
MLTFQSFEGVLEFDGLVFAYDIGFKKIELHRQREGSVVGWRINQ